ncbi:hypothetical protein V6Z12_A11G067200 [Gossypium hirsutum]
MCLYYEPQICSLGNHMRRLWLFQEPILRREYKSIYPCVGFKANWCKFQERRSSWVIPERFLIS